MEAPPPVAASIPLPGVEGRIDHMAVDLARRRLYIAALGNRSLEVVDLDRGRRVEEIGGWTEPQGICFVPATDRLFVADGNGEVTVLDGGTLNRLRVVRFSDDADNVRLDARTGAIYVGFGGGGLGALDARNGDSLGVIRLPEHPESFQIDGRLARAYVNLPREGQVAVVDLTRRSVEQPWRIRGAGANFPLALDESGRLLFAGCRKPPRLLLYDTRTGRLAQSLPLCGDVDDLSFDASRGRLYASCGEGVLEVFGRRGAGFALLSRVPTAPGARTSLLVPQERRLYVAVPRRGSQQAEILVYDLTAR